MTDLMALRMKHGRGTAAWVGDGTLEVGDDRWLALSGAPHADYNLALAASDAAVAPLRDRLLAHRRPAQLALVPGIDPAPLVEAGWKRVGSAPFMQRPATTAVSDPAIRALRPEDEPAARELIQRVFGLDRELAAVAVRPGAFLLGLWDEGELRCSVVLQHVEDVVVGWSLATDREVRRRGYGSRMTTAAMGYTHDVGADRLLLHASADGEPLYLREGWELLERWDMWSRPRWVLAS